MLHHPNSGNHSNGGSRSLSAYCMPGARLIFCIYYSHNSIVCNSRTCLLWSRIQQKLRSVLGHTSKEDYFLKFQKGWFLMIYIYSTLTLQRLCTFFFISSSQKPRAAGIIIPILHMRKLQLRETMTKDMHIHEEQGRGLQHGCSDSNFCALPTTPKLPPMTTGLENMVNAKPQWTYIVHSIQLTFINYWLYTIHCAQCWRLRSEKVTGDAGKKFLDYWGRPSCK